MNNKFKTHHKYIFFSYVNLKNSVTNFSERNSLTEVFLVSTLNILFVKNAITNGNPSAVDWY